MTNPTLLHAELQFRHSQSEYEFALECYKRCIKPENIPELITNINKAQEKFEKCKNAYAELAGLG